MLTDPTKKCTKYERLMSKITQEQNKAVDNRLALHKAVKAVCNTNSSTRCRYISGNFKMILHDDSQINLKQIPTRL